MWLSADVATAAFGRPSWSEAPRNYHKSIPCT